MLTTLTLCAGMALMAAAPTGKMKSQPPAGQAKTAAPAGTTQQTTGQTKSAAPAGQAKAEQPKATPPEEEFELLPVETKVIEKTNAERVRRGLRPLIMDRALVRSARRHTAWMTNRRTFQHSSGVAENIAMGQRTSDQVILSWMNSSGHRANMLNTGYTKIGVAAYHAPDGTTYWCQQFRP